MEAGERGKEELQTQIPWIPTTPLKPIRPRPVPICGSGERNQLNQTDFLGASTCCNSTHDSHAYRVSACFESAPSAEINSRLHDWEAPAAAGTNIAGENSGTCPQIFHNPMSRWANTGCTELLALADAASAAHFNATHPDNDGVKSPFILISESQLNRDPVANLSSFLTHHDLSPQQTQTETIHVNPQEPQGTTSVAFCSKTISQLAPPTPDKPIRAECRQLAGMQINVEERGEGEINNVPATKLDNNETSQNQDMSDSVTEISFAAVSMPLKENHNPHRGESEVIDLNKTPQQKSRRKKHRPKVISEGKSKRTQRPVIPKPAQSEKPTGKRKYVRRKGLDNTSTTPPSEVTGQSTESIMLESTKKSCRRALNFEIGEQPIDENSACKENGTTMRLGKGVSLPEDIQAPSKSLPKNNSPGAKPNANSVKRNSKRKSQVMLSPNDSSSNNGGILTTGLQLDGSKRKHSTTIEQTDTSSMNLIGARYNGLQAYQGVCVQFPNIQKKRRSLKGQQTSKISTLTALAAWTQEDARAHTYASSSSSWNFGSEYNASRVPVTFEATVHNKPQMFEGILSLIQNQTRPTKRRSKASTQVNHSTKQLRNDDKQVFENAKKPTCIDALVAETRASLTKKKRTKKKSTLVNSAYSSTNETPMYQNLALVKSLDATQNVAWNIMEALGEQFRHLDINNEGRDFACEEQNALVLYNVQIQEHNALVHAGGGTIVPFNSSFNPIRKQRPRPKVDLDDETNRVWELLMSDINNDGIDGKDKDKAKWWEEERRVFHGRADSFVARMRLVQGDRRFSGWKGSVVDSVVGVFLTQNVSDHLSSSAFVSLAAKFALKSSSKCKRHSEEGTSLVVKEPEVLTVEPEENTQWDEKILNRSVYDENSMTIDIIEHSEEKAVNSNSTGTITEEGQEKSDYGGAGKELNDVVSSQCSVISSQISGDFSIDQNPEKLWSCTDSNSEVEELSSTAKYNLFDNSTSFSKLLQLQLASSTMLHEVTSQRIGSSDNLKHAYGQSTGMKHDYQTENLEKSGVIQGSFAASLSPSSDYTLKVTHNSGVLEVHCFDHFKTEASSSGLSNNKDENDMNKSSSQITESGNQAATAHSQSTLSLLHLKEQNNNMQQNLLHISGQSQDLMQKATELDSGNHNYAVTNETKEMSAATIKSKGKRLGKKKKEDFNWDGLRVEAEARAGKRERTINNMDSLDWDAVRCADVNEIAEAIKERGMNNMLAERIKNFLNRLVQDHGSINLEWLRDVQPDQAKEFLLSIRGLGLKSVECVRLLTLHHLAFPVDTNVGRIAVRLGWVPLQPLPESLQLHLLELYPVLESIQKYLWPRLCKLDQNTLYELHYQMITFGKVFCTKNKPNCNACPMRGECRHFASAFASARLALPGPEQRSIVSTAGDNATDQNPSVIISPLPLPLPEYAKQPEEIQQTEVSRQLEAKSGINICHPIIEEPATPEPECAQISENDMEDGFCEDPCEIPTIKLNFEEFTLNLQNFMQHNMELQEGEMSKALVALDPEAASIPMPKLKNVSRLRTEHCVYELPDDHALLEGWDKREPDDPCSYLLAIWTPGETANSIQPPESKCSSQECGKLCNEKECFSCNSIREANMQIVRGTILIPCRTAMRGRFPLNGTYFQVNEVFADHDSSLNPINVPRGSIWELRRRTVYFGTSIPTIFKGLSTQEIQHCFWRGHVCVRGFDRKTRAPRPLMARLHFPASKLAKNKEKTDSK